MFTGGCVSQRAMRQTPSQEDTPPPTDTTPRQNPCWADTPRQTPTPPPRILRDTVNKCAVGMLQECILVIIMNVYFHITESDTWNNSVNDQYLHKIFGFLWFTQNSSFVLF